MLIATARLQHAVVVVQTNEPVVTDKWCVIVSPRIDISCRSNDYVPLSIRPNVNVGQSRWASLWENDNGPEYKELGRRSYGIERGLGLQARLWDGVEIVVSGYDQFLSGSNSGTQSALLRRCTDDGFNDRVVGGVNRNTNPEDYDRFNFYGNRELPFRVTNK